MNIFLSDDHYNSSSLQIWNKRGRNVESNTDNFSFITLILSRGHLSVTKRNEKSQLTFPQVQQSGAEPLRIQNIPTISWKQDSRSESLRQKPPVSICVRTEKNERYRKKLI